MRTVGSIIGDVAVRQAHRTVGGFLTRGDVTSIADAFGVDVLRLRVGLGAVAPEALGDLAERVRAAESDLARTSGEALVESATAIILAILTLILVMVS